MRLRTLAPIVAVAFLGCMGDGGAFQELTREQRLFSGKVVKIVSCQFAWGVEHNARHPTQDGFAVEYLSSVPRVPPKALEQEALEVFESIRPVSEQWDLSIATVTGLRTPKRTGTYDVFVFTRSPDGTWLHTTFSITRNTS